MTFRITKEFHFSASHQLVSLPPDHQCARLHGHNYVVEVELTADDHLNDVLGHGRVTAECLAKHFFDWCRTSLPDVSAVRVSETAKTWAEYRP
jgi:6-pyruvoyltetrahydropterin/6-carboxytetrahydropterin synthase